MRATAVMEPEIRERLCGLCRGHGWSYGVCWRFDRCDSWLLVMGDRYYEKEQIRMAVDTTITQFHLVGEGTIGVAAISGKHQWIYSDTFFEGNAEWQHQFLAGMKTIVIISLPSFGVVQFGSTEKICESLEFINQVRHLFSQLEYTRILSTKYNITSVQSEAIGCSLSTDIPSKPVEIAVTTAMNSLGTSYDYKDSSSNGPTNLFLDNDIFEGIELDLSPRILRQERWDDIIIPMGSSSCSNLSTSVSDCISDMDMACLAASDKGFSGSSFEQLLEAVVGESANLASTHSLIPTNITPVRGLDFDHQVPTVSRVDCPQGNTKLVPMTEFSLEKIVQQSSKEALPKSHVSSWIDGSCTMNVERSVTNQPRKPEETAKVSRKRARPGESTRPRPKDRQQIQDRVKELREIVPNGAKCSIDSLLDRTVKHILFFQSVTKYADKLKQTDEAKMIGDESGVVLKENSGGGATWAYEVAGQTMVCPILVEDLNPPGQMLVEMLCEERGFFLEIADIIRGFGLTILKGVMEIRDCKIWSRFLVEANRDVTRMDIFLSLVQLLQQMSSIRTNEQQSKALDKGVPDTFTNYQQPCAPIPVRSSYGA